MAKRPTVYIFSCGNPEFHGLSFQRDAGNLQNRPDCPEPWTLLKTVTLDELRILGAIFDMQIAITNLKTRGYHIARASAAVLGFPQSFRNQQSE